MDVVLEPSPSKTVQGLKIATHVGQDAPLSSDVPQEPCQDASSKKAPKEAQPTKQGLNLVKGSGALKAQKSGQSKEDFIVFERSGPLKVQKSGQAKKVNKRQAKADVKEKEGTAVAFEQHNVKRLKRMKEVKVKEHTGKGQLEKVSEVKIALKRDGRKKKAKKHVEKGLEDEGLADKALALVSSSKRSKLQ
ncbi:hypothetical protein L7F22_034478, partial [Adiantum nelumboides]|nr:hypothetical protein [Adiantum nelumboides]